MRVRCNGRTGAFQALSRGSTPLTRSIFLVWMLDIDKQRPYDGRRKKGETAFPSETPKGKRQWMLKRKH